jgi:GxxExxY protein
MKSEYDLAGKVIGLAMKVHSALGPGFLESVYQNALTHELESAGIRFEAQKPLNVFYDRVLVGEFVADFLVANELIVELKAVQNLIPAHEVQTVNYLVASGKDVGLLLNFGGERLEFKKKFRLPKTKTEMEISF